MDLHQTYDYIDLVRREVDAARKEPEFSAMLKKREARTATSLHDDKDVLRVFAHLIAYSQNAKAGSVTNMLDTKVFDTAFSDFEVNQVCIMNSYSIEAKYWDKIKVIRFKKKIRGIIGCAKSLSSIETKYGSFIKLLSQIDIPPIVKSSSDIEIFWHRFDNLLHILRKEKMPFFSHTTSLLHFLLSTGHDCIKPDIIVMRVAKWGNMVLSELGDENRREVVKQIQFYSVDRQIRPSVVDLYFLIYGGQTGVNHLVHPWFYTQQKRIK
jgi:3-methyladenine DNA glycosylase Tag